MKKPNQQSVRRTPKIFGTSYQPPRQNRFDIKPFRPILIVAALFLIITLIPRIPLFTIRTVEINELNDSDVTLVLRQLVGQSLFSRNVSATVHHIEETNVTISQLNCQRGIPHSLHCQVSYRQPVLLWKAGDTYFAVDASGLVFSQSPSPTSGLTIVEDQRSQHVALNQIVLSSGAIEAYQKLATLLQAKGIIVKNLFVNESLYQIGAVLADNRTALFVIHYPLDTQVALLAQILQEKNNEIEQRIDLRVPGYIYYQ